MAAMVGGAGRRIAAAAAVIAVFTVVVRLAGFARTLVFAGAVGTTDLGDIYQTANTIPNILFEIVAGGALAVILVPLLAGAAAEGDRRQVADVVSALLTWTVLLLVPLALLLALFASPVVALLAGDASPQAVQVGARMLRVFAVQVPLYGVGVVLTGVLHAHHRFIWPVLAPLLSSLTVIAAYLMFALVDDPGTDIARVSPAGELILSVGTTLGVAVLTGCLVIPIRAVGVAFRPRLALGAQTARRAVSLASAAVVTVAAQQLATAYLIRLANGGPDGSLVLYTLAQAVYLLPWAVLVVPLSTPTFPILAAAAAAGDTRRFDATLARTTRAVLLAAGLGTSALVGLAQPMGRLLSAITATHPPAATLAISIVAFAPGLLGFAMFALFNRALNAAGEARRATTGAVIGWAATVGAALVLAATTPAEDRVPVLAAASSVGMTVLGAAMVATIVRRRGSSALAGFVRTLLVSLGGAALAGGLGWAVSAVTIALTPGVGGALVAGMLASVVVGAAFGGVVIAFDRRDTRPLLAWLTRRASSPAGRPASGSAADDN